MNDTALIEAMARAFEEMSGSALDAQLRAALAAIRKTHAVVPREPTDAMLHAAQRAWTPGVSYLDAHAIRYRAMLTASEDSAHG